MKMEERFDFKSLIEETVQEVKHMTITDFEAEFEKIL